MTSNRVTCERCGSSYYRYGVCACWRICTDDEAARMKGTPRWVWVAIPLAACVFVWVCFLMVWLLP